MADLCEEERRRPLEVGLEAIRRIKEPHALGNIALELGRLRYSAAVPTLAELWQDCALHPLRTAAGHALREIGTPAARTVLVEMLEDADHLSVFLGVRAIFDQDPMGAFDLLEPYFEPDRVRQPGGMAIPVTILSIFAPGSFTRDGPGWTESRAPGWLRKDRRWFDLCIGLRHDEHLGEHARAVLRYVERELVEPALAAAVEAEGPRVVHARTAAFGDLLTRYRGGDHLEVWRMLRSFEAIEGDLREEADAVARETMQRVAHNVDLLASRLQARGWRAFTGRPRTPPGANDSEIFAEIERITKCPLPPSLRAFWEIVGGVDFVWDYNTEEEPPSLSPDLSHIELYSLDPLYVDAPAVVEDLLEEWQETAQETHPELLDPFALDLAPDYLHKADISGGAPYGFELPARGADPVFVNEEHLLPFVDYLRLNLKWGGFSRLERHADDEAVAELVAVLTEDFAPF